MPYLSSEEGKCDRRVVRCPRWEPCITCEAVAAVEPEDWETLQFYRRVAGQFVNQTPLAGGETTPVLTPRLESWETVLRAYHYPVERWGWLISGATVLHDLLRRQDSIGWVDELDMELDQVTPEAIRRWFETGE